MNVVPPLLLPSILLPFLLLSMASRFLRRPNCQYFSPFRSALLLVLVPVLLSSIFAFPHPHPEPSCKSDAAFSKELDELKLKIAHLETILEDNTNLLKAKVLQFDENIMLAEELGQKIDSLQGSLDNLKRFGSSYSGEMIAALEEEVHLLWVESRKNNFDNHMLEANVKDAEEKVGAVASEAEKMKNIIAEQWIQIRQLEHALQTTKIMTSRVHKRSASGGFQRKLKSIESTILKFFKGISQRYLPEAAALPDSFFLSNSLSSSCTRQALDWFKRIMAAATRCHHELQYFVKRAMEGNEYTAALANEEVVFFLASAMIVLPLMSGLVLANEDED